MDIVYHPILALLQLGIAGYNTYISKYVNFEIGVPKVRLLLIADISNFSETNKCLLHLFNSNTNSRKTLENNSSLICLGFNDSSLLNFYELISLSFIFIQYWSISNSNLVTHCAYCGNDNISLLEFRDKDLSQGNSFIS